MIPRRGFKLFCFCSAVLSGDFHYTSEFDRPLLPVMEPLTQGFDPVEAEANLYRNSFAAASQKPMAYFITASLFLLVAYSLLWRNEKIPRYNPKRLFELTAWRAQSEFMPNGKEMLIEARKKYGQQPYRLHSDAGDVVVLPGEYMQEIRNNPALSFMDLANYVRIALPITVLSFIMNLS